MEVPCIGLVVHSSQLLLLECLYLILKTILRIADSSFSISIITYKQKSEQMVSA